MTFQLKTICLIVLILTTNIGNAHNNTKILKMTYSGFTLWVDCERKGAIKFQYTARKDIGEKKRSDNFYSDPNIPNECAQTSTKTYGQNYDRGHMVPANHMDASDISIKQTNFMTNILPQAANMNRGAWLLTEEIVECYRDIENLIVIGGVIWGNDTRDDFFVDSHGITTPDAFWKVIIRGKGQDIRAIAWIVPNSHEAKRKNLDSYQVSIKNLEKITNEVIPVPIYAKQKISNTWTIPIGCNKG